ncbi:hypothetical protein BBJ28_00024355, partial [Nothophytophthora sp. Chile5]
TAGPHTHNAIHLQQLKLSHQQLFSNARPRTATMNFAIVFVVTVVALLGTVAAANSPALKTPTEALEVVQGISLPDGVTLTGTVEKIDQPDTVLTKEAGVDGHKEMFGWGGWGGLGPYRFGISCGGIPGWAYPLGYWNMYGGGCGLGMPFGGLYYC